MEHQDREEAKAYEALRAAAKEHGLAVWGGKVRRTSSRFCLGVEHGDYNGTELLGVGTDRYIWLAYAPNSAGEHRMFSCNFPGDGVVRVPCGKTSDADRDADRARDKTGSWAQFVRGVDYVLRTSGLPCTVGIDAVVYGNIPGGGMSRSASLCINLIHSVCDAQSTAGSAAGAALTPMRVAELSQAVENDYIGSPCGCLDQVMIAFAEAGCATRYDPATRTITHIRYGSRRPEGHAAADDFRLLVLDTGTTRHGLEASTYTLRVKECRRLCELAGLRALADVKTPEQLEAVRAAVAAAPGTTPAEQAALLVRLQYIYEAQHNFARMVEAWEEGDIATVGALFRADGIGLRDKYCISGPELEAMCDIARTVPGVFGERMLGGGDKGASGLLCAPDAVCAVRAAVQCSYPRGHPQYADRWAVHECRFVQGVALLPGLVLEQ